NFDEEKIKDKNALTEDAELDNQVKFTVSNIHIITNTVVPFGLKASIALRKKLKEAIYDHYKFWKAGQPLKMLLYLIYRLIRDQTNSWRRDYESKAICNRIFFQLLKQPNDSWNGFKIRYNVTLEDVLRRIAKYRTQEVKDLNVIIILDGLQVAMDDTKDGKNKSKNYLFYDCISILCILSFTDPFVIVCCTVTISIPIHGFLASSQQKRVFLPVTSLQPPKINNIPVFNDSSTMNMFIDDMGGHGHALEALGEAVVDKDMIKVNYIDLINNVRLNLKYNYSDDVITYGLVRFESSDPDRVVGYLSCPYIWLWIMAHAYHENINDPLLRKPNIPPGCQYWQQHFEHFVAQFRSLKSNIYNYDNRVDLSVIHNGATHNFGQVSISNRQLTLSKSVERSLKIIGIKMKYTVLEIAFVQYIWQRLNNYKRRHISSKLLREQSISQKIFEEEYNNATSSGDIFIFYTSASCQKLELQPMSAIVNKENWKEYFGTFAGRCYNYVMGPPVINKATFTQLSEIEKIAKNVLELSWKNEILLNFLILMIVK
ncbi:13720_t:CDS:2, partial [Funneliformis mosseae]